MLRLVILIGLLGCTSLYAETPGVETTQADEPTARRLYSAATFEVGLGKDSYRDFFLSGDWAFQPRVALTAQVQTSRSQGDLVSSSLGFGAMGLLSESFLLKGGARVLREPEEVRGVGFRLGEDWVLSALWAGELRTNLGLELERIRYTQGTTGVRRRLGPSLTQTELEISLIQELSSAFTVGFRYFHSFYSSDPASLNQAVGSRWTSSSEQMPFTEGFAKNSYSLLADLELNEEWEVGATLSQTQLVVSHERSNSLELRTEHELDSNWKLGGRLSGTRTSGRSTGGMIIASASYRF